MIIGVGTDVLEVARLKRELARKEGLDRQLFTPGELAYCRDKRYPARHLAARFAAKEAFFKALGAGPADGVGWRDVEVKNRRSGAPLLVLRGQAKRVAARRGVKRALVSLAHTAELATACVVLES
jgi:holo-[acyl-carrier protein] synthase